MALMKTSNPALGENTFRNLAGTRLRRRHRRNHRRMTLNGTVNKTGILLALRHRHRCLDMASLPSIA